MADDSSSDLKIRFKKSKDHKIYPASGIWGGPTPQGEILCNFFVEYPDTPDHLIIKVDKDGRNLKEEPNRKEGAYTREITNSILLQPDTAISIGKWLVNQAENISKTRKLLLKKVKGTVQ